VDRRAGIVHEAIDNVGDFEAVVKETAKSVNISGEPTLVHPEKDRKTLLDLLLGDVSQYIPNTEKMLEQHVGFYYLWKGGVARDGEKSAPRL